MLYLIGNGGYAKQVLELAQLNVLEIDGIFMPAAAQSGIASNGIESKLDPALAKYPIISAADLASTTGEVSFVLGIEDNRERQQTLKLIMDMVQDKNFTVSFPVLIHPQATVSPRARVGEGTIIQGASVIGPDVEIGNHCVIASGSSISPDCILEDFVWIGPNVPLESHVIIRQGSLVAANSCVVKGVTIGQWAAVPTRSIVTEYPPDQLQV